VLPETIAADRGGVLNATRGHDQMIRSDVHGAQVQQFVHAWGALDLGPDQL
jgi:hypothetical protein